MIQAWIPMIQVWMLMIQALMNDFINRKQIVNYYISKCCKNYVLKVILFLTVSEEELHII